MSVRLSWRRWVTVGFLVTLMVTAFAIFPQTSFAQTNTTEDQPTTPAAPWGRGGMMFHARGANGEMRALHDAFLAETLGITVEELQAAQQTARAAMVAKAVEDGIITQEQADLMAARHAFLQFYLEQEATTFADALRAAVEAGVITQEQADLLQAGQGRWQRGMFGRGADGWRNGERGGFHPRGLMPGRGSGLMPGRPAPTPTPEANS